MARTTVVALSFLGVMAALAAHGQTTTGEWPAARPPSARSTGAESPESTRAGPHFRVICHFASEEIAGAALETVEPVWDEANGLFGVEAPPPAEPLDVHIYRSAADYERAEAGLTHGAFRQNLAFAHEGTKSAHVALQPDCTDEVLKEVGLNRLTRWLLAHEAAHLYRYATMPNHVDHPHWLADGAADCMAEVVMTRQRLSPGVEQDPMTATYSVWGQRLAASGRLPGADAILRDEIELVGAGSRYAVRWLFFRFMQAGQQREAWKRALADVRRLGGGQDFTVRVHEAVMEALGNEAWGRLDGEFKVYVNGLKPEWEQVYRALEIREDRWVQMAFPDANAIAWRTQPIGRDEYRVEGSVQVLPGGSQQMNLLLGRSAEGFVSVAFVAGYGVTVFRYRAAEDRWERMGATTVAGLDMQRWVVFRVQIADGKLVVTLGRDEVLSVPVEGVELDGAWGVGAQAGAAGLWRDVAVREDAPRRHGEDD